MALYETVFIIRQDLSSADVDKLTGQFSEIVTNNKGKIIKTEYWGLRNLAYDISNNKKGHYVLMCIDASSGAIHELERKMRYSEHVIRFLTLRVDSISSEPSPILREKSEDNVNTIEVTVS